MWDYLARWWWVEVTLWICYWNALARDDRYSSKYCVNHSLLLSVFWAVALVFGLMALGRIVSFLQGGCR
ncbi:hypothetical protein KIAC18_003986 [Sporomusa sphaeroides]|uniref:hypothetical protein n=1 Tax=Sporomusa sphaeroides TaxID=47679 RepID=UPI003DA06F97